MTRNIIIGITIFAFIGFSYYLIKYIPKNLSTENKAVQIQSTSLYDEKQTKNWKLYKNQSFGLQFYYPQSWKIGNVDSLDSNSQSIQIDTGNCTDAIDCQAMTIYINRESNSHHLSLPQLLQEKWSIIPPNIQYISFTNPQHVQFTKILAYPDRDISQFERQIYALHNDTAFIFTTLGNMSGEVKDYNTPGYLRNLADFDNFIQTISFIK